MTLREASLSFVRSLQAGETRSQAHATVRHELDELLAELLSDGLPSEDVVATLQAWDDLDPRTIRVGVTYLQVAVPIGSAPSTMVFFKATPRDLLEGYGELEEDSRASAEKKGTPWSSRWPDLHGE
jgi:hypothetical protein